MEMNINYDAETTEIGAPKSKDNNQIQLDDISRLSNDVYPWHVGGVDTEKQAVKTILNKIFNLTKKK